MRRKTVLGGLCPLRKGRFRWPALLLVLVVVAPVWGADYQSGDFRLGLATTLSGGLAGREQRARRRPWCAAPPPATAALTTGWSPDSA